MSHTRDRARSRKSTPNNAVPAFSPLDRLDKLEARFERMERALESLFGAQSSRNQCQTEAVPMQDTKPSPRMGTNATRAVERPNRLYVDRLHELSNDYFGQINRCRELTGFLQEKLDAHLGVAVASTAGQDKASPIPDCPADRLRCGLEALTYELTRLDEQIARL